jgi:putative transposase
MSRRKSELKLTKEEKQKLEEIVNASTSAQRELFRARIILQCAQGYDNTEVAEKLNTSANTVGMWRRRYVCEGISGLEDAVGRGRKAFLSLEKVKKVIEEAVKPPPGRTHW